MGKDLKGKELGNNIFQSKDGYYIARYTDNFGKRHDLRDKKLREVSQKLRVALYEKEHGIYGDGSAITFDSWFLTWMNTYKIDIRDSTRRGYYCMNKICSQYIGSMQINSIRQIDIQKIMTGMKAEGYHSSSMQTCKGFLHNIFTKVVDNNLINKNPVEGVRLQNSDGYSRRVLTVEEQSVFFKHIADSHYYEMFRLMLLTGMRIGETMGLRWDDVDYVKNQIHIRRSISQTPIGGNGQYRYEVSEPKTASGKRDIPLNEEALMLFKSQKEKSLNLDLGSEYGDLVFRGRDGAQISTSNIRGILRHTCQTISKHGFKMENINPHCFRHTFCSRACESGIDVKTLSTIMGHKNIQITMNIYTHSSQDKLQQEINKIMIDGVKTKEEKSIAVCSDLNNKFSVEVPDDPNGGEFFVIYDRPEKSLAKRASLISFRVPMYKDMAYGKYMKWVLSDEEKQKMVGLLKGDSQKRKWGDNWSSAIINHNGVRGLDSIDTMFNKMDILPYKNYLPIDLPMPDYMDL
ncbi:MAG: tyrosine-type recombinase/integrase [Eubacteriales bacterium]